ncbi:MAG: DeoR/GlpR transcriptional regulator [Spirochaetes bacterium]|nr:DeoR/GlpR transcriptional regulator [Spirochaetota bacterium]
MLTKERHDTILRFAKKQRYVSTKQVVSILNASEATVRRDFQDLETRGLIRRMHGGIEYAGAEPETPASERIDEEPLDVRKNIFAEQKRLIAKKAASLVAPGETIIIDGGSTTYYMAEFLADTELTVITNSFAIANALRMSGSVTVILLGGMVYRDSQMMINPFGDTLLANYSASKLFMSPQGIDESGITNTDTRLIATERLMIARSREVIVLADASKFGERGNLAVCGYDVARTVITDSGVPEETKTMLTSKGVNLLLA